MLLATWVSRIQKVTKVQERKAIYIIQALENKLWYKSGMVKTTQCSGKKIEGCSNLSQKCSWQFSSLHLTEEQQDLKAEAAVGKIQSGKEIQGASRRAGGVGSAT